MAEPLRLVVNVQVLLSGVTQRRGPSHDLWQAARRFEVVLILGEQHFAELGRVLTVHKFWPWAAEHLPLQ